MLYVNASILTKIAGSTNVNSLRSVESYFLKSFCSSVISLLSESSMNRSGTISSITSFLIKLKKLFLLALNRASQEFIWKNLARSGVGCNFYHIPSIIEAVINLWSVYPSLLTSLILYRRYFEYDKKNSITYLSSWVELTFAIDWLIWELDFIINSRAGFSLSLIFTLISLDGSSSNSTNSRFWINSLMISIRSRLSTLPSLYLP